jgi:hypothetical protein
MNIGETIERDTVRIHRFDGSFRITDLTNAGKRGKKCHVRAVLYGYGPNRLSDLAWEEFATALDAVDSYEASAYVCGVVADAHPGGIHIEEHNLRGVDVEPAGFRELVIESPCFRLEVGWKSFTLRDARDRINDPRSSPAARAFGRSPRSARGSRSTPRRWGL